MFSHFFLFVQNSGKQECSVYIFQSFSRMPLSGSSCIYYLPYLLIKRGCRMSFYFPFPLLLPFFIPPLHSATTSLCSPSTYLSWETPSAPSFTLSFSPLLFCPPFPSPTLNFHSPFTQILSYPVIPICFTPPSLSLPFYILFSQQSFTFSRVTPYITLSPQSFRKSPVPILSLLTSLSSYIFSATLFNILALLVDILSSLSLCHSSLCFLHQRHYLSSWLSLSPYCLPHCPFSSLASPSLAPILTPCSSSPSHTATFPFRLLLSALPSLAILTLHSYHAPVITFPFLRHAPRISS